MDLFRFREKHTPQTEFGPFQRASVAAKCAQLTFIGWVISYAKAMVFPVVMYGCESWTVKKAEHQRIDTFEL